MRQPLARYRAHGDAPDCVGQGMCCRQGSIWACVPALVPGDSTPEFASRLWTAFIEGHRSCFSGRLLSARQVAALHHGARGAQDRVMREPPASQGPAP